MKRKDIQAAENATGFDERRRGSEKKRRIQKIVYAVLIVFFLAVFLVSGYYLLDYFIQSKKSQDEFSSLASMVDDIRNQMTTPTKPVNPDDPSAPSGSTEPVPTIDPYETVTDPKTNRQRTLLREYSQLYLRNPDMVGWIRVNGTVINYPVMQTPNYKDYYLYVSFNDEYSNHGCIYAREECDIFRPSDNITIYGHHMRDGSMFAELERYEDKAYWQSHRYINFDTIEEHHTYEIFAVFKTSASVGKGFTYHNYIDFAGEWEFDEFVNTARDLAFFDTDVEVSYGDKFITLSTCEYTLENGRLVVVAKRID